jgi:hypothetical protein
MTLTGNLLALDPPQGASETETILFRGDHSRSEQCVLPLPGDLLTELSPSWGTAKCAATQELTGILWHTNVQYRVHKNTPLVPIISHINPIHTIPSYLSKIHFNTVHLPTTCFPSGLFPSDVPTNIPSPIRATCPAHLILFDLSILIILGEE